MSLFFQLFAGVAMDEMDTFPLVPLGCWLFPIGIYLLVHGFGLGMDKQNRRFVIVRCGWIQKWWKHFFLRMQSRLRFRIHGMKTGSTIRETHAIRSCFHGKRNPEKECSFPLKAWIKAAGFT